MDFFRFHFKSINFTMFTIINSDNHTIWFILSWPVSDGGFHDCQCQVPNPAGLPNLQKGHPQLQPPNCWYSWWEVSDEKCQYKIPLKIYNLKESCELCPSLGWINKLRSWFPSGSNTRSKEIKTFEIIPLYIYLYVHMFVFCGYLCMGIISNL
jgi:hypothetical protein